MNLASIQDCVSPAGASWLPGAINLQDLDSGGTGSASHDAILSDSLTRDHLRALLLSGGTCRNTTPGSFCVDMGNTASESAFGVTGWENANISTWNPFTSPSGDRTKRYQQVRGDASVTFSPVQPGTQYRLVPEVEDGACFDSYQIGVNGIILQTFDGWASRKDPPAGVRVVTPEITLPPELVTDTSLLVNFRNVTTDECGKGGVYNVRLERAA